MRSKAEITSKKESLKGIFSIPRSHFFILKLSIFGSISKPKVFFAPNGFRISDPQPKSREFIGLSFSG